MEAALYARNLASACLGCLFHHLSTSPQTILALGGFGMSVITALTAQNSRGVQGVHLTPDAFLGEQLDSIFTDLPPAAIKTGMLPNGAAVEVVAAKLRQYYPSSNGSSSSEQPPLVIDPVLISTSGHALAGGGVGAALRDHLAPLATMLTPNLTEAEELWGKLACVAIPPVGSERFLPVCPQCLPVILRLL